MISTDIKQVKLSRLFLMLFMLMATLVFSCKKNNPIGDDPYGGGKLPLGVSFDNLLEDAGTGLPGDQAMVKVRGLLAYKGKFEFMINEIKAEIVDLTDSTLTVTVPENASSGGTSIVLDGQTFFGPKFTIEGRTSIDATFKVKNGADATISDIVPTPDGNYIIVGAFSDYEGKAAANPVNGIAKISRDGEYIKTDKTYKGAEGFLQSIVPLSDGKYMIGGILSSFNKRLGMSGITRINGDVSLDSTKKELINPTPLEPSKGFDTVATFNGGVTGMVRSLFVKDDKITAVGSFSFYTSIFYERSTRLNKITDFTKMNSLVRMKLDGTMDSTFNFNKATKQGYSGVNGMISDATMQADGKIVIAGLFSNYNGSPVNNIARVDNSGALDPAFRAGSGADGGIVSMVVNKVTGSIMISGQFKNYNGVRANGVVLLRADGSIDPSFKLGEISGGFPTFATQLNSGKILVSGSFNKYNGIVRQGFMILNGDGSLAAGYNNTGMFQGQIYKVLETTSGLGNPALLMVGSIYKFDGQKVGNIVRVEIK